MRVLYDGRREPGRYEAPWSGENGQGRRVASGVYFYRLTTPGHTATKKMHFVK